MILYCNFEELAALNAAASRLLESSTAAGVVAPPHAVADLEALVPRLTGDITVESLSDQAGMRRAVAFLTDELRSRMDASVLEQHPAAEDAVLAYFEYAHALSVLHRLDRVGREMAVMIEVMTGHEPASEAAQRFSFGDD